MNTCTIYHLANVYSMRYHKTIANNKRLEPLRLGRTITMTYFERLCKACSYYNTHVDTAIDAINDAANIFSTDYNDYCKMSLDLEHYAESGILPSYN